MKLVCKLLQLDSDDASFLFFTGFPSIGGPWQAPVEFGFLERVLKGRIEPPQAYS